MTRRAAALAGVALAACAVAPTPHGDFAADLAQLRRHGGALVLTSPTGARIAVLPAQGAAVMTSTTGGDPAPSFGSFTRRTEGRWRGGEDHVAFGPVAGRFACTPPPDAPRDLVLAVVEHGAARITCAGELTLQAATGDRVQLAVRREVQLHEPAQVLAQLGLAEADGVRAVSFTTTTTVTNAGTQAWSRGGALPALRIAGEFPAAGTTVMLPFVGGPERYHGPVVLGAEASPSDRLRIDEERSVALVSGRRPGDAIGIGPRRAKPIVGCWQDDRNTLTLVEFTLPLEARNYADWTGSRPDEDEGGFVVATWSTGSRVELASHAPALALAPGAQATHTHRTTHLIGPRDALAAVACRVLGAELPAPRPPVR